MTHDLSVVDAIRERMPVGYEAAVEALDACDGDLAHSLAYLEQHQAHGLEEFEERIREGVRLGLSGQKLRTVRWRVLGQLVGEVPVYLAGVAAVLIGLAAILISSSTVETEYSGDSDLESADADQLTEKGH